MSAGKPNFQRLYEMGKLPDNQRHQIPGLLEREKQKEKSENIPTTNPPIPNTPTTTIMGKCLEAGCDFSATGTDGQKVQRLRMHTKSHNKTK